MKYSSSLSNSNIIEFKKYAPNSYIKVEPITINMIVSLLSFEKFLSKYEPKYATTQSITAEIPIVLPNIKSNIKPKITPNEIPKNCVAYKPINKIYIINKLGLIPAIVK